MYGLCALSKTDTDCRIYLPTSGFQHTMMHDLIIRIHHSTIVLANLAICWHHPNSSYTTHYASWSAFCYNYKALKTKIKLQVPLLIYVCKFIARSLSRPVNCLKGFYSCFSYVAKATLFLLCLRHLFVSTAKARQLQLPTASI